MEVPPPATKLPLGIKKGVRDYFEAEIPKWNEKLTLYTASPSPFEIDVDILQLYAYAKEDRQKQNFGSLTADYIRQIVKGIDSYTRGGTDIEAQQCFAKAVNKYRLTIIADYKVDYCGLDVANGVLRILFHPDKYATNSYNLSTDGPLAQTIDSGESGSYWSLPRLIFSFLVLSARDNSYLPLVMSRGVRSDLMPKLAVLKEKLRNLFGKDIEISYDLRSILNTLSHPQHHSKMQYRTYRQEGALEKAIPKELAQYFDSAVRKLESFNFHLDDLYKSEWLNAAPKGILFEVVEQLQTNAPYNECIYQGGYFRLRTNPNNFGVNHSTIADRVVDQL